MSLLRSLPTSTISNLSLLNKCTVAIIEPIIIEIKGILEIAIQDVEALVGSVLDVVLYTVSGVLSLLDLCKLISAL
ncbi:hypothetical protein K435DRAFT_776075 [Dendrothele bispora CBS 962.96]|uniref:Uncharacterized protein n=1 Tax=Dendrothele bispora (strain CBS 962.96) TaxID=1314807 RepID=A0A4S8MF27_DENBC|nr:hypothetical protein K435DRAFT_776075 [Dendrothele bispora CBS 962.96]